MSNKPLLYFKNHIEWRNWLHENHETHTVVELIFYKVTSEFESMRWEEAVKVAICYGWIDSTVRKLDDDRRKQTFTPRKDKSVWSKVNKNYIEDLIANNLMHESGLKKIEIAKQNGSWESLDAVENLEVPEHLKTIPTLVKVTEKAFYIGSTKTKNLKLDKIELMKSFRFVRKI